LLARRDRFAAVVTEKLLTYALGRTVEHYDMPAVRAIVRDAAQDDYRLSALVLGVANSVPFRMKMKAEVQATDRDGGSVANAGASLRPTAMNGGSVASLR
jgi:hypothetical protein